MLAGNELKLAVVVPMHNEVRQITQTLDAIRGQHRQPDLVVLCDNASTDETAAVVNRFIREHRLKWQLVEELEKGTGAACDTAIRTAINSGATHIARTDADCLPRSDWLRRIGHSFEVEHLDMVLGLTWPRRDDIPMALWRYLQLILLNELAILFVVFRPSNYGNGRRGIHWLPVGNNLAISAKLYLEVGGFPRTRIEELHEDHALMLAVRSHSTNYGFRRRVRVYASARRLQAWGMRNTLRWYRNHDYRPPEVDIR